jgi:hypothetical protein
MHIQFFTPAAHKLLGGEKVITSKNTTTFGRSCAPFLQARVNSNRSKKAVYWPLVRSASIKYNSQLLKSGIVLMDVPGVADTNAVRNEIAKNAMRDCDCICIATRGTRAIDDKTAQGTHSV